MKTLSLMLGAASLTLLVSVAGAADSAATTTASAETHEQSCGRWADAQGLKDSARSEYMTDCARELRNPDKPEGGGGEE